MKKFIIDLKYGMILFKISFAILLILAIAMAIVLGYNFSIGYHNYYISYIEEHQNNFNPYIFEMLKKGEISNFWTQYIFYSLFFITPMTSYYISQDEENRMNAFILRFTSGTSIVLSRLIALIFSSFIVSLIAGIVFSLIFYQINGEYLNIIPSMLGAFLILTSLSLFGAFLGYLLKKRHWAIIFSIFLVLILSITSNMARQIGDNYMDRLTTIHGGLTLHEYLAAYPLLWKILIFISPFGLVEMFTPLSGIHYTENAYSGPDVSLLGLQGDIYLSLTWIIILTLLSLVIFKLKHRNSVEVKG